MMTYAIADASVAAPPVLLDRVRRLNELGADFIQLRAKELDTPAFLALAERCRQLIDGRTKFLVNGRADIAAAAEADGVHLPADGLPAESVRSVRAGFHVGRSCHDAGDVKRAADERCDYVLLGPIFPPRSKEGGRSLEREQFAASVPYGVPLFVLGGIDRSRLAMLADLNVSGVAAVTLYMSDEPIEEIMEEVRAL